MTRAASLLLRVVGLALVLVAAMGFALVGDGGAWTAHATVPAGRTVVLVEPAVASVLGPAVSVQVTPKDVDEAAFFLGRGRSDDLATYVQGRDVVRIAGFDGSRRLALEDGPPPASASTPGSASASAGGSTAGSTGRLQPPMTVDLWQQQVTGLHARELSWRPTAGARSILVAHEDGSALPALDVTVTWTDGRWLWYPVAALLLGVAMIAGGLALVGALPLDVLRVRAAQVRSAVARRGPTPARPARRSRTASTTAGSGSDEGASLPSDPEGGAPPALAPDDEPITAPAPAADSDGEEDTQPASEALLTRRAARGRRRKETAWQRARAKAMSRAGGRR